MTFLLAIEASQPDGSVYRLGLAWSIPALASWFALIGRLF